MEELCIDGSRRRVVARAKCIQDDLKIQLRVYRTNRNQTYRYSNYTASLHSLWVTYHCFPDMVSAASAVQVLEQGIHGCEKRRAENNTMLPLDYFNR